MGIVVVSSKLDEIQKLSDRIAVMYEGEFMATVEPAETTEAELGMLMAGHGPEDAPGGVKS
jgi:simple sugar transport system ATP-binding protein